MLEFLIVNYSIQTLFEFDKLFIIENASFGQLICCSNWNVWSNVGYTLNLAMTLSLPPGSCKRIQSWVLIVDVLWGRHKWVVRTC